MKALRGIVPAALLVALAASPTTGPKALAVGSVANDASALPAYMAPYVEQRDFSGVVLVAGRNGTIYDRAFGAANVENGRPNSVNTIFAVGSVTKTFTAAAIELLAERGKLHYDDTLDRFVPEYRHAREVSIDQLLSHSAGIPDYYALPAFAAARSRNLSLSEIARWLGQFPLDFVPGSKGRYSNSGYSLLALVVERASGESYAQFLNRNVFAPLGLRNTFADGATVETASASGYDPGPRPSLLQTPALIAPGWLVGNGSVRSNARDLSAWLDIAAAGTFANLKSLPYPNGWSKRADAGATILEQDGRIPGFASTISVDEQSGLKIVVLSNIQCAAVSLIASDLRKAANGTILVPPTTRPVYQPSSSELTAEAGRYAMTGLPLVVTKIGNRLTLSNANDGMLLPLDAVAPDHYFFRPLYASVAFKTGAGGKVVAIEWGGSIEIPKV